MPGRLQDRVAVVTGASSGIGAACARLFTEEGARVAGLDVQEPPPDAGLEAFHCIDVREEGAVADAVAALRGALSRIDVLVNAAGVAGGGPLHELDAGEWDRVVDVNLKGTYLVSKHVLPAMLEARSGAVVHVASVEGMEGFEGGSAYNASKGGVVLLTRNMAIDYGRRGIRTNCLCPGFIETPLLQAVLGMDALAAHRERIRDAHQLGRFGRAEEVAHAALFLASDESSFVNGAILPVDGGYTAGHRFGLADLFGLGD